MTAFRIRGGFVQRPQRGVLPSVRICDRLNSYTLRRSVARRVFKERSQTVARIGRANTRSTALDDPTIRQALIEGEKSGEPKPFNFNDFKLRKAAQHA